MMSPRSTAFARIATLAFVALAGCNVGSQTQGTGGSENDARIRVVNATDAALDLTASGQIVGGAGHVNANAASSCISINASTSVVGLREAGALSDIGSFAPTLIAGTSLTVVAFISDAGSVLALTLPDIYAPTSGLAGLRIVDVAPGLGTLDVYITPRSGPLGIPSTAAIGFGGNTGFFDADPGISQVRFTTTTTSTVVFDAGTVTLQPGRLYTMVLSQPGGADAPPVASLLPAC